MANGDNTQQNNPTNGNAGQILAILQELAARMATVEEIIRARLNTTRPFDDQVVARFDQLDDKVDKLKDELAKVQEEVAKVQEEVASFRAETNQNFRMVNQKLGHLNNDFLAIRAEHSLLEQRVTKLEDRAA
jgi:chromosome segregation ATPase